MFCQKFAIFFCAKLRTMLSLGAHIWISMIIVTIIITLLMHCSLQLHFMIEFIYLQLLKWNNMIDQNYVSCMTCRLPVKGCSILILTTIARCQRTRYDDHFHFNWLDIIIIIIASSTPRVSSKFYWILPWGAGCTLATNYQPFLELSHLHGTYIY